MSKVRMLRTIAALAALVAGYASCVMNLTGSGTEAGNGRVVGRVVTGTGAAAQNTELLLIPSDYVSGKQDFASDTTDSAGNFQFAKALPGDYSIQGVQQVSRKRVLITAVRVDADRTTTLEQDSVRSTGSMQIALPDSMRKAGGRIVLQGTTFGFSINGDSIAVIDSLPSGIMPALIFLADTTAQPATVATGVTVQANDTTVISAIARNTLRIQPGDDLQAAVDRLLPGDSLILSGGLYEHTGITISSRGNERQPVTIAAQQGQTPVLRITVATDNCININGAQWLTIDGITIDSTQDGVDGIKFTEFGVCHNVTIHNCTIHAIQGTGINAQGAHYSVTISSNHVYEILGDAVTGIRVAPATTSSMPHDWLIAGNWVHAIGDSISTAAFGISLNSGCYSMTIRDNVVYAAGSSGILIYGLGDPASDGSRSHLVEGNAVWNASEGISAYCDVTVRNNVIFDCANPVYSYSYQGAVPRYVLVNNNTMYNGEAPYLRSWDTVNNCAFVNNAVYEMTGGFVLIGNGRIANNAGDAGTATAAGFITGTASGDLSDPGNRNFYPKAGSTLIDKGLSGFTSVLDFNETPRDSRPDIGAYEFTSTTNPGWAIKEGFKNR